MIESLRSRQQLGGRLLTILLIAAVLLVSAYLGQRASSKWLILIFLIIGSMILSSRPALGLALVVATALFVQFEIGTGTAVSITAVTLFLPFLFAIWLLNMALRRSVQLSPSRANLPLLLFLVMGLLSLLIGTATWDPGVPRNENFTLVQMAQWAIFFLSALAFWLTANLIKNEAQLETLTWVFLGLGGILAVLSITNFGYGLAKQVATLAFIRAPFWLLLTGIAGGQLFFNLSLSRARRTYLVLVLISSLNFGFVLQRSNLSIWLGIAVSLAILLWLRLPRVRWVLIVTVLAALVMGGLFPTVYEFAGGESEWVESGGSRLALIERVVEVTMRNPVTGLGPAAYRMYAAIDPLPYGRALWIRPQVSSHNNWVDLFSHVGLVGVGLFLWFAIEIMRTAHTVTAQEKEGFRAGYASGMLAAWISALTVMLLADWILPFVYNIGFAGFQASVLLWLFLGGLVALKNIVSGQGTAEP